MVTINNIFLMKKGDTVRGQEEKITEMFLEKK